MKATGIVRRIDDLGRVVIPKEIRRTMRIKQGDPLEIYTDREGDVIFRKYSLMGGISDFAAQICDTVYKTTGRPALVTDRDTVLAVAGASRRDFGDKPISGELEEVMMNRGVYQQQEQERAIPVVSGSDALSVSVAAPILAQGDVLGCVVIGRAADQAPTGETEYTLTRTIAGFLGRHMES
ncbi:MAG: AbrB/MazE/SpoVT family DNA-binding domain-containing protein [Oscillospiraceae bacterium]|nr:AbrB/MazE/SpoVT family DNA-binding domain-containing protein [Oscillospiraceae bacterium]